MRERVIRIARWFAYPLFYLFCLAMFGYITFPYGRVKDRIITEFERRSKPGQRLEIDRLSSYWFTGVEFSGVKLILPPDDGPSPLGGGMALPRTGEEFSAAAAATAPRESTITIEEGHARVRILPLLIGRVRIDFWASALGGEIEGTVPVFTANGDVELELTKLDIGKIEPLTQLLGLPLKGLASGKLQLTPVDGKFNKANGQLDVSIEGIVVGDGKTKIQGLIELPAAKLGTLTISAEAKEGALKVTKLNATGTDLELIGDGRVAVREPWNESSADLYLKFKFTDAYRTKNETTKSLLGEPGSSLPGLMEIQVPKMKRAKRSDGFYGWHVVGPLRRLKFDPSSVDVAPSPAGGPGSKLPRNPQFKRPPLGGDREDDTATPTPPSRTAPEEIAAPQPPATPPPAPTPQAPPPRTTDQGTTDAPAQ